MTSYHPTAGLDFKELFRNPDYFLWQFDGSQAMFARMTRNTYHDSIFCDRRIVAAHQDLATTDLTHLLRAHASLETEPPQLCYVFHVAHCGSTLLARALDIKSANLVCREPMSLRQLAFEAVAAGYDINPPEQWLSRLRLTVSLLGRRYNPNGPVIVKTNVPVNFVIPELLRLNPATRAVMLYSTLENYLSAVLKSSEHQQWLQLVFEQLLSGLSRVTGIEPQVLSRLAPAEMAACLWVVQMTIFTAVSREAVDTKTLDSEALFEYPEDVLADCFRFFGQPMEDNRISQTVSSDLFCTYAKSHERRRYDNAERLKERASVRRRLSTEMSRARAWLEAHGDSLDLEPRLPNPLSGGAPLLLQESE